MAAQLYAIQHGPLDTDIEIVDIKGADLPRVQENLATYLATYWPEKELIKVWPLSRDHYTYKTEKISIARRIA